jgi:hypothetical protein
LGGIYENGVELGSGAMIYIPSFIEIESAVKKFMEGGIHRHTGSMVMAQVCFYLFKIGDVG